MNSIFIKFVIISTSKNCDNIATYLLMATVKPADECAHGQTTSLRRPFPSNVFTNESQAARDPEKELATLKFI